MYDLELDESMVDNITRIGRLSSKPKSLRVQLGLEWHKNIFLDSAYKLKTMKRYDQIWEYRLIEHKLLEMHRTLMLKFRLRRKQGEKIRIEGNKIVPLTGSPPFLSL